MKYGPTLASLLLLIILFGGIGWWNVYKYHECKKVGHATFYCIMSLGAK